MTVQPAFSRRTGLTLLEVLITIFVMAIGLLSVLTLFPLAARKIVRSIDNDRAALMAANADGSETILGFRSSVQNYFSNAANLRTPAVRLLPSGVVHFDPIGDYGGAQLYVNFTTFGSSIIPSIQWKKLVEWFTSQDEIQFQPWGVPEIGFRKGNRYSVSYLYRRNALGDSNSLDTVMLIYTGRPIEFGNTALVPLLMISSNLDGITVSDPGTGGSASSSGPDRVLGRNSWIMDQSLDSNGNPVWKKFYQVQSTEITGLNQVSLVFDRNPDQPIKQAVWVDYLFDWFDRGIGP